jgi:hypothetical protein
VDIRGTGAPDHTSKQAILITIPILKYQKELMLPMGIPIIIQMNRLVIVLIINPTAIMTKNSIMKKIIVFLCAILFINQLHAQWKDINPNPPHEVGVLSVTHFFNKDFGYIQVADTSKEPIFLCTLNAGLSWNYLMRGAYCGNYIFFNSDTFVGKGGKYIYAYFGDSIKRIHTFSNKISTGYDELYRGNNRDLYINCYKSNSYPDSIGTYRSIDYGFTWHKVSDTAINQIGFINDSIGFGLGKIISTQNYFLVKSIDAGLSWSKVENTQYGADYYFNEDTFYTTFISYIGKSIDGGINWRNISNGLPENLKPYNNYAFINTTTGFVYSNPYGLYKTTDAGENWELLSDQKSYVVDAMQCIHEKGKVYIILSSVISAYSNIYYGVYDSSEIWSSSTSQMLPLQKQFSVFPNPASHEINITYSGFISAGTEAGLYNVQGQLLKKISLNLHKKQMDISTLPKGIYLLKINTERGLWVEKVVKE